MIALEFALLLDAVILFVLTLVVMACAGFIAVLAYERWTKDTGGFKGWGGPVAKFFKRVKRKDGGFDLVPYDEVDEDPIRDKEESEDEAAGWEDDYMDGVLHTSPRAKEAVKR